MIGFLFMAAPRCRTLILRTLFSPLSQYAESLRQRAQSQWGFFLARVDFGQSARKSLTCSEFAASIPGLKAMEMHLDGALCVAFVQSNYRTARKLEPR
jgi:hypothetical protein